MPADTEIEVQVTEGEQNAEAGNATSDKEADPPKLFTQAELEAQIKTRLEREKRKADEREAKAKETAKAEALAEQGEFKTLAEQRAARIAQLEPLEGELEESRAALQTLLDAELTAVPEEVREAISDKSPAWQLQYITKHRGKWTKKTGGVGSNPDASTGKQLSSAEQEQVRRDNARSIRSLF
jgi:hypothetical protein